MGVILKGPDLEEWVQSQRKQNRKIVFTNGCFDLLHVGHLKVLRQSKALGDVLVVGVNSDGSVKRLKGKNRPINTASNRMELLAALEMVDAVVSFREDTPRKLIQTIAPDVLVKGGDYKPETVVGGEFVRQRGGEVVIVPLVQGASTTGIAEKIRRFGK